MFKVNDKVIVKASSWEKVLKENSDFDFLKESPIFTINFLSSGRPKYFYYCKSNHDNTVFLFEESELLKAP